MRPPVLMWGFSLGFFAVCLVARGDEPAQKFLNKLRENEYHDVAIDYLTSMENSALVSPEFKQRIKFEKAESLLLAAAGTRDIAQIEQYLNQADLNLQEFAATRPDPLLLAEAERVRARTLFGRGNLASIQAQAERWTAEERNQLQTKAREFFGEALSVFEKSLANQREVVKNFKVDSTDPNSIERRDRLWREYVETRFMAPAIREQIADTMGDADPQRKALLTQAATEFADIASDYARFSRGSYARIAAARCYSKLGQPKEALKFLVEVLADNVPRAFKQDAAVLAIECWEKSEPPGYAEICGRIGDQTELLAPRDIRDSKIAAIQLGYAKACRMYAEELNQKPNSDAFSKQIQDLRREAARFAGNVARGSNALREDARKMIAEWNMSETVSEPVSTAPASFAEAKSRAIDLLDAASQIRIEVQQLAAALSAPGAKAAEIEPQLQSRRAELVDAAEQALEALRVAQMYVDSNTSRDDINGIYMRRAVANFYQENYWEAVVLGEHLLNRYPSVAGSREAAGVAMRALVQLNLQTPENDRAFERKHLETICREIVAQWPDEPGTDEAANILITLALQNSDVDQAKSLLNTMEKGSASRAKLETHMGRMVWNQYLLQSQKSDSDPAVNQRLLNEAEQLLASGIASLRPETLTVDGAFGALNLVQLHLAKGEVEKAIDLLETGSIAPLDVIKQKLAPVEDARFVRETYRTALQAYVSGMRQGQQASTLLDKAHNIVVALRESTSTEDSQPNETLIAIYYQLTKELLTKLDQVEQPDEKAAFAQNFATFIQSLREQTNDAKTNLWIGSTLNSVADKLAQDNLASSAKQFRSSAVEALEAAAATGFSGDANAEALQLELSRQQAIAHRGLGDYDKALAMFADVLRTKTNWVQVQADAALTHQLKADQDDDPDAFAAAVAGSQPEKIGNAGRPTNLIWGWRQIALATKGKENFSQVYFDALYNMAYCRLRYGEVLDRPDAKQSALSEIQSQHQIYPEMGGPQWKTKFVALAKRIQKSLGQTETGLQ